MRIVARSGSDSVSMGIIDGDHRQHPARILMTINDASISLPRESALRVAMELKMLADKVAMPFPHPEKE